MEKKEAKIEGKIDSTQVDKAKLARRKWCPCIAVAAIAFLFMIIGGILTLRAYFADSDNSSKPPEVPPQTEPSPTPPENSTPKTKPKNPGGNSTPAPDESAVKAAAKEKMINFFLETALSDTTDRELYVIRWNKPAVSTGVAVGIFDDVLNGCLDGFINDFNQLVNGVDLYHDNTVDLGVPNIKIFYLDEETFNARARGVSPYGYVEWDLNDDYSIKRISMNISYKVKETDPVVQCQVIRHEMMHAVGFWGHSDVYPESIMSLPKTVYSYPTQDKWLVELLYNIGLPLGTGPAATREFLNANYPF